jgi:predicted DCC family thiol-disulfide oxidoreductase YuxK
MSAEQPKLVLVYDRECPVCSAYVRMVRIRRDIGQLELVNARESSSIMDEVTNAGLNIDQGMVLMMKDRLYFGADAIHMLAMISTRNGWFNRLNHLIFASRTLSKIYYPIARGGRNLLLKLLGRTMIDNLDHFDDKRF